MDHTDILRDTKPIKIHEQEPGEPTVKRAHGKESPIILYEEAQNLQYSAP